MQVRKLGALTVVYIAILDKYFILHYYSFLKTLFIFDLPERILATHRHAIVLDKQPDIFWAMSFLLL